MDQYIFIPSLKKLKKDMKASKKEQYRVLLMEADRAFLIPLESEPPKKSTTYLSMALMNLTLAYLLSEDQKYFHKAKDFISTLISYPYWGNAHLVNVDLSASFILFGLSLSYAYLKEELEDDFKKKIEEKIIYQSSLMVDYIDKHPESWPSHYFQNHNWINYTGLAMVSYVLKDHEEVQSYKKLAYENFKKVFSYLPNDGSDYEGATYWRYGVLWLFIYAYLLKDQEGIDLFKTSSFLKNTFSYRLYQSSSSLARQLNFGDTHDLYSSHSVAIYYLVASIYHNGYAQKLGNEIFYNHLYEEQYNSKIKPGILPESWLTFLWYNPNIQEKELSKLPKVKYFKDLGLICIREGFKKSDKVFSFKCSSPGGNKQWKIGTKIYQDEGKWILSLSHHHPDNLSYIYTGNDDYYAVDDGYNRAIYPHHHNVLLVDNQYSDVEGTNDIYLDSIKKRIKEYPCYNLAKYQGKITSFSYHEPFIFVTMENQNIYPLDLKMKKVSRSIFFKGFDFIMMIDEFSSEKEHYYQSVLNEYHPLKNHDDIYEIFSLDSPMYYQVLSRDELILKQKQEEITSIMTTQEPDIFTKTTFYRYIFETKEKRKNHVRYEIFSLNHKPFILKEDEIIISSREKILLKSNKDFSFEGKMLYIKKEKTKILYYLIKGNLFRYKNKTIIDVDKKVTKKGEITL